MTHPLQYENVKEGDKEAEEVDGCSMRNALRAWLWLKRELWRCPICRYAYVATLEDQGFHTGEVALLIRYGFSIFGSSVHAWEIQRSDMIHGSEEREGGRERKKERVRQFSFVWWFVHVGKQRG